MRTMSENHTIISTLYHLKVKDLQEPINQKASLVEKSEDIETVFHLLEKKNHVWVVDDKKSFHVIGVITTSDTFQLFAPPTTPLQPYDKPTLQSFHYGLPTTVGDIMSTQPITVHPEVPIVEVILTMKQQKIKQLPVIDENERLIGEITINHLIKEYLKHYPAVQDKVTIDIS